jgi:HK97 gp10 family phage protein
MIGLEITGDKAIADLLGEVAPRHAANISAAMVHGVAGDVRDRAKAGAPVDEADLKKAIKTKKRRRKYSLFRSDVIVLRRAFYWRFIEYGEGPARENAFFLRAVESLRARLPGIVKTQFLKKLQAAIKRAQRRAAR